MRIKRKRRKIGCSPFKTVRVRATALLMAELSILQQAIERIQIQVCHEELIPRHRKRLAKMAKELTAMRNLVIKHHHQLCKDLDIFAK